MERVLLYFYILNYPSSLVDARNAAPLTQSFTAFSTLASRPGAEEHSTQDSAMASASASDHVTDEQVVESLTVHAQVYALADRFIIPGLKKLAQEKFADVTDSRPWPPHEFVAAAIEVIRVTPSNDHGLRSCVSELCARHLVGIAFSDDEANPETQGGQLDDEDWQSLLREDTYFTWDVLKQLSEKHRLSLTSHNAYKDRISQLLSCAQRELCKFCQETFQPRFVTSQGSNSPLDYALECDLCSGEYNIDDDLGKVY